jgi:hypothetical protein
MSFRASRRPSIGANLGLALAVALTVVVVVPAATSAHSFEDVPAGSWYDEAVGWLVDQDITTGIDHDPTVFHPDGVVDRGQMATFLWRMFDQPAVDTPHGFADVADDAYFAAAVRWLKAAGITTGVGGANLFDPEGVVTRGQMATFLWRAAGRPSVTAGHGFDDVPDGAFFDQPVRWLKAHQLTTGFAGSVTSFVPDGPVTRSQMAAFLHRLASAPLAWATSAPSTVTFDPRLAGLDPVDGERCDILDPRACLLPFPNDQFTTADATTGTGRRLSIMRASMPANAGGTAIDPAEINRNDGFSPGQAVLTFVPGIDLAQSGAAPITDMSRSLDPDAPVVLIDAVTGERHPHWVEMDSLVGAGQDRLMMVNPARNFLEGRRYLVVLRNLRDAAGDVIPAPAAFGLIRDGVPTSVATVEDRRADVEALLDELDTWGVARNDLYLAWDFTVASEGNLSERMLTIRDDAFANLADASPAFTVTKVDPQPGNPRVRHFVEGTFTVPNYLTGTGAPGSGLNWGSSGLPEQNVNGAGTSATVSPRFRCVVPEAASSDEPARIALYGHGLLGAAEEVFFATPDVANEANMVFCAADWWGMSSGDIGQVLFLLQDLSFFHRLPDRGQQGFLNFLFLGRLMLHEDGLASHPAFQDDQGAVLERSDLFYNGNSQGGIMGGALAAVAQDFTRAVLGVPGMNYSTMLRRSSNWNTYSAIFNPSYPDQTTRPLVLGLIQMLWDRAEANGYAHHLTADPYPETPAKDVLLFTAFGDYQVANVSTDVMARTIGASIRQPALGVGRSPDVTPFWGIPAVDSYPFPGSAMVMWDFGAPAAPTTNVAPGTPGFRDPHGLGGNVLAVRQMAAAFLQTGGALIDVCDAQPCFTNLSPQ